MRAAHEGRSNINSSRAESPSAINSNSPGSEESKDYRHESAVNHLNQMVVVLRRK